MIVRVSGFVAWASRRHLRQVAETPSVYMAKHFHLHVLVFGLRCVQPVGHLVIQATLELGSI